MVYLNFLYLSSYSKKVPAYLDLNKIFLYIFLGIQKNFYYKLDFKSIWAKLSPRLKRVPFSWFSTQIKISDHDLR